MSSITKLEITWNLYRAGIKPDKIADQVGVHRATAYRWIKKFRYLGYRRTMQYYKNCKKRERRKHKRDPITKRRVFEIRKKYHNCCGEKIKYYLKRDHDIDISVKTIYLILNEKYKLRSKYKKGRSYVKLQKSEKERDIVQVDTVHFGELFAYTYIDTFTRQAHVEVEEGIEAEDGARTLQQAGNLFGKVKMMQTDGGPEFKGEFTKKIQRYAKVHRVSRPYKKNEQAYIESFNRSLRKECLGWKKYRKEELEQARLLVKDFLRFYNNERPHLGLGMRIPNEVAVCRI